MAKQDDEIDQHPANEGGAAEPPPSERPTINVNEAPDDDFEEPTARQGAQPARPGPRARAGFKEMKTELAESRKEREAMRRELDELRGRASAPQVIVRDAPAARGAEADPAEAAIDNIQAQQDALLAALATPNMPAEQSDKFRKQWYKLDRERQRAIVQAETRGQRQQQTQPQDVEAAAAKQILESDFPKIFENEYFKALAIAETNRIAAEKRQRPSLAHAREASAIIYQRHGLGPQKSPAPTDAQRSKYEASGTRPAPGARAGDWTPSKQEYKLAMAYGDHRKGLDEKGKLLAYYNEVLKPAGLGRG